MLLASIAMLDSSNSSGRANFVFSGLLRRNEVDNADQYSGLALSTFSEPTRSLLRAVNLATGWPFHASASAFTPRYISEYGVKVRVLEICLLLTASNAQRLPPLSNILIVPSRPA